MPAIATGPGMRAGGGVAPDARRRAAAVRAADGAAAEPRGHPHARRRSRRATLAVAASLLRHVAAEAVYLGIQPATSAETERGGHMRDLLDARSAALADHGLDMRTELRPGDVAEELQKELAAYERSMLVLGTSNPGGNPTGTWLSSLLEGRPSVRC